MYRACRLFYATPEGRTDFEISPGIFRDQLPGYVPAQRRVRFPFGFPHVLVRFPISVCRVRVRASRRRVRHPSRSDDPGSFAGPLSPLHDGSHSVLLGHRRRTVRQKHVGRHSDRALVGFDAAQVSGGRASGIGHLIVNAIRLIANKIGIRHEEKRGNFYFFFLIRALFMRNIDLRFVSQSRAVEHI